MKFATLEWVEWFNDRRLLEPIGTIPPAEAEARSYARSEAKPWPPDPNPKAARTPGAVHWP